MTFQHAGGILAMIVALFVAMLLILALATVLGAVGGIIVEGVFVLLAAVIVVVGVIRYSRP